MSIRIDLFCAASDQAAADAFLTTLYGTDQSGSLSIRLSPTGEEPATHFGASGVFSSDMADSILEYEGWTSFVDDGSSTPLEAFEGFAASLELQRIFSEEG